MVPLQAGDIMVMGGSFNRFFVHKTLRNCQLHGNYSTIQSVLDKYPAVRSRIKPSIDCFLQRLWKDVELAQRFCITFRRIKYHKTIPRCPCLPGILFPDGEEVHRWNDWCRRYEKGASWATHGNNLLVYDSNACETRVPGSTTSMHARSGAHCVPGWRPRC